MAAPDPALGSARIKNADGFAAVALRATIAENPAWDVPNETVVELLDDWSECEFGEHRGFVKSRNLTGEPGPDGMIEVRDSFKGNTQTCMRRRAEKDSSKGNILCYVPNGPSAVKLLDRWLEVRWKTKQGFLKSRHAEILAAGAAAVGAAAAGGGAAAGAEPPAKKAKIEGKDVTEDLLGPPVDLLAEDQPDWQFELDKDKWKSYRPEESVELERYWRVYCGVKEKGETEPRIARLRLMKKDAVIDLAALSCSVGGGKPRSLRRQIVDPGLLSNSYFCKAFEAALAHSGVKLGGPPADIFDFRFNQDFRELKDDGREMLRGGKAYKLPFGWKRFSVKVQGDGEDDTWLRDDEEGWAVAYHGTSGDSLPGILSTGFKVGSGQKFAKETGVGIYCAPDIDVAQYYSKPSPLEGHYVQVVLQLRVKPSSIKPVTDAKTEFERRYWVINKGEDIRAYGVLVRELHLRDYIPVHYVVFGPAHAKGMMNEYKKEADAYDKKMAKEAAAKAKAKAKVKAKAKAK